MATSSIKKSFVISDKKQAYGLIDAIENSINNRPVNTSISSRQIKNEKELREFLSKGKKVNAN